jgi:DDE superfamily endonuclease/Helix-turn-helix of DDE superfamily endonuclease
MQYEISKKRPVQFLSITSLSVEDFDFLLPYFHDQWDEYNRIYTLKGKLRQRISFIRKDTIVPKVADKLLFLLVYLKTNPLQEHHAASFGITQPQANDLIHLLSGILRKTLKFLGELPERNEHKLKYILSNVKDVLLDGVERPIQRPQASDLQKSCYSGKKKTHSLKNDMLSKLNLRIVWLSRTYPGSVHDKKICNIQPFLLPKNINLWQDTGFQGHKPEHVNIHMPVKKRKGKELTEEEKESNRSISSTRVKVEHAIGGAKICRIIKDRYRCHKFGFDDLVIELASGLHNLRLTLKNIDIAV